jgi:DNA-binding SARP family transcriptional activator
VQFRILGPLEAIDSGRSLPLGSARQRAMLALLLTRPNEVVSTDRMIDELWGAKPPRTALNIVQYYVSQLRKVLGAERIVTRPPGYAIRIEQNELDLEHFELLLERGDAEALHEALALWRGPALADFVYEPFASEEIARLEELRLVAHERRVEADLERGRSAELVAELEQLIAVHPLRERLRGQLMLALYRSGRQAEALAVYQDTRKTLVEELGIEPGPALQELERSILQQDPALEPAASTARTPAEAKVWPERSIVVAPAEDRNIDLLLALAVPLALSVPARELIVARLVAAEELAAVARSLQERCEALAASGVSARAAAFTSAEPGPDLTRLAADQDADLVLVDAPTGFLDDGLLGGQIGAILDSASCDVGVLVAREETLRVAPDQPLLVPFGGAEHDWAAVELAAWIVRANGSSLRLVGREADLASGERDASRLLASASLLVQRAVRVPTEPLLVAPGPEGILGAAADAGLLVFGLSDRWRQEGLGETRLAIAKAAPVPTLLVRKGLRPGGIAPDATMTRFTWSLGATEATVGRR